MTRSAEYAHYTLGVAVVLLAATLLLLTPSMGVSEKWQPSNRDLLLEYGFGDDLASLSRALRSEKPFARLYAVRLLTESSNDELVAEASPLLKDDNIFVRVGAATYLAHFGVQGGRETLQAMAELSLEPFPVVTDTVMAVLEAASVLAQQGDYTLAPQVNVCMRHPRWLVRTRTAMVLGDFKGSGTTTNAWLAALGSVRLAIEREDRPDFVAFFLKTLLLSAEKESVFPESVVDAAWTLREVADPKSEDLREQLLRAAGRTRTGGE